MSIDQWLKPTNKVSAHPRGVAQNKQRRLYGSVLRLVTILLLLFPQVALAQISSPDVGSDADAGRSQEQIQDAEAYVEASVPPAVSVIRTINTASFSTPSSDPTGIVFIPSLNRFLITDSEIDEIPAVFQGANLYHMALDGSLVLTGTTLAYPSTEPTDVTFNTSTVTGTLYVADDVKNRIYEIKNPGADGIFGTNDDPTQSFRTDITLGVFDLESLAYAEIGGVHTLFFADGSTNQVFMMQAGPNGVFNAGGDDVITSFDAEAFGITSIEGVAYHSESGTLYIAGVPRTRLAEATTDGKLLRLLDISAVSAVKPSGLGFGPGANPTLYMTDRNADNVNDGKIYEFGLPAVTAGNQQPVVDAGPNQVINLPAMSTTLAGVATDASPLTTKWTVFNSRSVTRTVAFVNNDLLNSGVTFPKAGTYVLRLTADDNQLAATDLVTITVNALPVVNAGADQSVAVDAGAVMSATVTDDGLPLPSILTTTWSLVSGPGTVTFTNPSTLQTAVSFSGGGVYVLKLSVNDGGGLVEDTVTITANAVNRAPVVDAGANRTIAFGNPASLAGIVSDDGLPISSQVAITWSVVTKPEGSTVTFSAANSAATTASFSVSGQYVLQLFATDGELSASDTMTVSVALDPNQPPTVNAGDNQTVVSTSPATLNGTVEDDGKPNPPAALTITWSKVSGPGTVTFGNANAKSTTATFSAPGIYVLVLTANDGDVASDDTVEILVNEAPKVNAGPAQTIALDEVADLDGTVTDDGRPTPVTLTTNWTKVSGPGNVTFGNAALVDTTASFSAGGQYVLRLSANDNHVTSSATTTVTVLAPNNPPVVSAGVNLTVTTSAPVNLDGTVTDDGRPTNVITTTWNKVSGPGTVTFGNPNAVDTTASFSAVGTYVLRLTADDGELETSATVRLVIQQVTSTKRSLFLPLVQKPK